MRRLVTGSQCEGRTFNAESCARIGSALGFWCHQVPLEQSKFSAIIHHALVQDYSRNIVQMGSATLTRKHRVAVAII